MKFRSTRASTDTLVSLSEAIQQGLAPDGGLYVPNEFPVVNLNQFTGEMSYPLFASELLRSFFAGDQLAPSLDDICKAALNFPIPLRMLGENDALLELFHGPTSAFKDVGARFLAECVSRQAPSVSRKTVIVATSGDTGGAVAAAFFNKPDIDVFVLYPKGGVSSRQEQQIAGWGGNIQAFAVRGSFDDCQRVVKEALADQEWRKGRSLISANSISVGRLLPQMVYYARSSLEFSSRVGAIANYIIPTGNLGNACAAMWAKRLGFPIGEIVLATNANRTLVDFFKNGEYQPHTTIATIANAMDVGNPSNVERVRELLDAMPSLRASLSAVSVSDEEIRQGISRLFRERREIVCPHTATAFVVRQSCAGKNWIMVATAHPAKFETVVEPLIGAAVPLPPQLCEFSQRQPRFREIAPSLAALKAI